jgi:FKBP-type peptidyl-prolyl cis-trans isomerase
MYKYIVFISIILFSCNEENKLSKEKNDIDWTRDHSTKFGENIAKEDEIGIKLFLKQRSEWKVKESGTGLRYWVYEETDGVQAKEGDEVQVQFKVELLDGTLCYQTEADESSFFKVDKSDVETGVHEGIKYMREGERAKLIIPSHLGHGLIGDLDKIPPMEVLVVDLFLKKIK